MTAAVNMQRLARSDTPSLPCAAALPLCLIWEITRILESPRARITS
jgi:hypothetical protein